MLPGIVLFPECAGFRQYSGHETTFYDYHDIFCFAYFQQYCQLSFSSLSKPGFNIGTFFAGFCQKYFLFPLAHQHI
jgi:hypothetical protein